MGSAQAGFGAVLFAASAVGSGFCANLILFEGQSLYLLRDLIIVYILMGMAIFISPLLLLTPTLYRVKNKGLLDYGALSMRYVQSLRTKWLAGVRPEQEILPATDEISCLADLQKGYETIYSMRRVPIGRMPALILLASAVAPSLPLFLTVWRFKELVKRAVKMLL